MDFYKAYAAVHNSDLRQEIDGVRDEISEMDFSLVSDAEVISIAEEVLLEIFEEGYSVEDAEAIFEEVITEAKVTYGHDTDNARKEKVDKLKSAMKSAMGKVKEKASRGAVKTYAAYRSAKSSAEMAARRAGQSIKNKTAVAQRKASENKGGIKAGLKSMVKKAAQAVGKVGAEVKKGYDKGMKKESYLETDMEKRKKNNEKARKDMKKMGSMKNPHFGDGPTGSMSSEEVEMGEAEKPYPYGKVGDKLRKVAGERDAEKDPKKRNKLASRLSKINREYNLPEAVMGQDREMRKAASMERNKERAERGGAAPKIPGKEGPSAGKTYADYQKLSIAAHDKATKKNKNVVGLVSKEEVELQEKELSIDDQMRISREANAKRKPYQPGDRQKQRGAQIRQMAKNAAKDTRTDAQKMADAYASPRKGPGGATRAD